MRYIIVASPSLQAAARSLVGLEQFQSQLQFSRDEFESFALVGAWFADDIPRSVSQLAAQRLVTVIPSGLPLKVIKGSTSAGAAGPGPLWHLEKLGITSLNHASGGAKVRVGVVDTGVDMSVDELKNATLAEFEAFDVNGALGSKAADLDAGKHGTHVASLIVGENVGVAPAASLSVAAMKTSGDLLPADTVIHALKWMRGTDGTGRRRADVINFSLHIDLPAVDLSGLFFSAVEDLIVTAAVGWNSLVDRGNYPGNCLGVTAVGSCDELLEWGSSSWGFRPFHFPNSSAPPDYVAKPELHAPGVAVPLNAKRTKLGDGTSYASALVAGAAAVVLGRQLVMPSDGESARQILYAATRCLRFKNRMIPGAWIPSLS
jgi:subtilisin family serine protease